MASKSYAIIYLDGEPIPAYASHTGGESQPKTREVPQPAGPGGSGLPGTMIVEPTGGLTYSPLELSFSERTEEGVLLDSLLAKFIEWRDAATPTERRKSLTIQWYQDTAFSKSLGVHEIVGGWCSEIKFFEGDRSSDDPRSFSATIQHMGSTYKASGA